MKNYLITISISAIFALSLTLTAQPAGSLDPTFADNGKFVLDNGNLDLFTDVEMQNDGKIVAVGITYDAAWVASAQAIRLMSDGTIDDSFATNGVFTYSLNFEANVYGCVIRDNGKIVMTGSTTDYNDYRILLIQLNEDGTLDNSFGDNGIVVQKIGPDMNSFEDHSFAIALQDDGMIVVAGKSYNTNFQFVPVVVRFTEEGQLDTSFGTNGVASVPVIEVENDFDCLVIQDDGKIIASGHYANTFLSFAMLVARFMPDGSLDETFGNNGIVNYPYSGVDDEGFGIRLTSDNHILITGFTVTPEYDYSMLMMKFDSQGDLDPDFGSGGIVEANYGQFDVGYSLYVQGDEKVLVAGTSGELVPGDCDMAIWRYNPDGTLDNSFGIDGMAKYQFDGNTDEGLAMAHQSDGNIIIAGKAHNGSNFDYAMIRILNDYATAISETKKEDGFSVAPNPVMQNNKITISYEVIKSGYIQAEFIDSDGKLTGIVELGYRDAGQQISSVILPVAVGQGVYCLRLKGTGNEGAISKIIVKK